MHQRVTAICLALAFGAFAGIVACNSPTREAPKSPTALHGHVREGGSSPWAGQNLAQAKVEVTGSWGSVSALTSDSGEYWLTASGDVTVRAEKEGFSPQVKQVTVDSNRTVDFELEPVVTPGDPRGEYRLTITASPSCTTLPAEAMQRQYSARIDGTQDALVVSLSGGNFAIPDPFGGSTHAFTGTRTGNTVHFEISDDLSGTYAVIESLGMGRQLSYAGTATGTASDTTIVAAFDGTVRVGTFSNPSTLLAECQGRDHRLGFVR